jgi:hypothetical protein
MYQPLQTLTNMKEMIDFWRAIVNKFSGCELAMADDRLVALSGIAKFIANRFAEAQYLAGLWREEIQLLLWDNGEIKLGGKSRHPQVYRTPSWSWASIDGKVFNYPPGILQWRTIERDCRG